MAFYNKLGVVSDHIISHVSNLRPSIAQTPPLMVGIQGPQGSGKTYITKQLETILTSPPHNLRVAVLSIDDLYLPYTGLRALFDLDNPLLKGRGLPGTHDVELATRILDSLHRINGENASSVEIPFFDKSLNEGFGDRAASSSTIKGPIDVVILEGWFVGFYPLAGETRLQDKWAREWATEVDRLELGYQNIQFQHIVHVNEKLKGYVELWDKLSVFVQVR
ncbi:P-loop containing nucleoside triphosphate hydrolase protein [Pterulicium gracile]|uniref:P-loop containing nucleoside triphosphate hydrolase protein n=1 Tax=Pterulicium gracile TaxID=1884261 RepID=A0A5C3R1X5_9AGAR|nr:P-loop containing nucleoside triphosphate hydrolase protein [Pterula gracilis]